MSHRGRTLVALKRFTYATRRLLPGDDFEVRNDSHARALVAIGKARPARKPGTIAPPPAALLRKVEEAATGSMPAVSVEDIAALRSEYEKVVGKRPFHGWNAEKLRQKIDEARAG